MPIYFNMKEVNRKIRNNLLWKYPSSLIRWTSYYLKLSIFEEDQVLLSMLVMVYQCRTFRFP